SSRRRSPHIARRSASSPTSLRPIPTSAMRCLRKASSTRRLPHIAGRSKPHKKKTPNQRSSPDAYSFKPPPPFPSLDHLVGKGEHPGWKFDAKSPGSSLVEGQLELDRCLYRKISRFRALEDAIHIRRRPTHEIDRVNPIGHQSAVGRLVAIGVDRW